MISELHGERAKWDVPYLQSLLEKAKPYTVALYQYQVDCLEAEHNLSPLPGGALGLNGHYNEETGFSVETSNLDFLGVE